MHLAAYQKVYPRDDYRDCVNLVALMVGFDINVTLRKTGAMH